MSHGLFYQCPTFLYLDRGGTLAVFAGYESSQNSSKISYFVFLKMNGGLTCLEQHEGKSLF